jgi:hypothetical protein
LPPDLSLGLPVRLSRRDCKGIKKSPIQLLSRILVTRLKNLWPYARNPRLRVDLVLQRHSINSG